MGQERRLKHMSPSALALLIENPAIVEPFLCLEPQPSIPDLEADAASAVPLIRTVSTAVEPLYAVDERIEPFLPRLLPEWAEPGLSLGKRWNTLQCLLAGSLHGEGSGLLASAIRGAGILAQGVDDGAVRYFDPTAVAAVGRELSNTSGEALRQRLEAVSGWDCGLDAVSDYVSVALYYREAMAMNRAMILYA